MHKRYLIFVLVVGMLSACASKPVWMKTGASTEDFGKDKYECLQGSMASAPAVAGVNAYGGSASNAYGSNGTFVTKTHDMNAGTREQMFSACMESKGWILQKPLPSPPPVPDAQVTIQNMSAGPLNNPRIRQAEIESNKCKQDKENGILSNYKQLADCLNNAWKSAFVDVGYPYLDLIDSLNATRSSVSGKEDANKMTEKEAKIMMKKKMLELTAEEIKRKSDANILPEK